MKDTNTNQAPARDDDPVVWLERCRDVAGASPMLRAAAARALERIAEGDALRRILKRVLDALDIHGAATEEQLIARVKARMVGIVIDANPHPDELNPNHPVTRQLRTEWHKFAAVLLMKLVADERRPELEITEQDVRDLAEMNATIVADARGGKLVLRLLDNAEAAALARAEGGLRS